MSDDLPGDFVIKSFYYRTLRSLRFGARTPDEPTAINHGDRGPTPAAKAAVRAA